MAYVKRSEVEGKDVIDAKGYYVGRVKDIAFTPEGEAALVVEGRGGEELIPLAMVSAIGDFILLKSSPTPPTPKREERRIEVAGSVVCPECGAENPLNAKYCINCGAKLPEVTVT